MSWYEAKVYHDGMRVGQVYWLEDTPDVEVRLAKGFLMPAEEPEWNRQLQEDAQWPRE